MIGIMMMSMMGGSGGAVGGEWAPKQAKPFGFHSKPVQ